MKNTTLRRLAVTLGTARLTRDTFLRASLLLALTMGLSHAQVSVLNENFGDGSGDGNTVVLPSGWSSVNLSESASTTVSDGLPGPWSSYSTSADGSNGLDLSVTPPGSDASYALDGFGTSANTSNAAAVSDWLITPFLNLSNGATLTFLTQAADPTAADVLEVALATSSSSTGAVSSLMGSGANSSTTGLFTKNLLTIGSPTTPGTYPQTASNGGWVSESITISGLPAGVTTGNLAFRYESADDSNTSYIGVADVAFSNPVVPEPSTWALMLVGAATLRGAARRRLA